MNVFKKEICISSVDNPEQMDWQKEISTPKYTIIKNIIFIILLIVIVCISVCMNFWMLSFYSNNNRNNFVQKNFLKCFDDETISDETFLHSYQNEVSLRSMNNFQSSYYFSLKRITFCYCKNSSEIMNETIRGICDSKKSIFGSLSWLLVVLFFISQIVFSGLFIIVFKKISTRTTQHKRNIFLIVFFIFRFINEMVL